MTVRAAVAVPVDGGVRTARYLLIATAIAMLFSTSVTVGLEFVLYGVFAWFATLRERLMRLRHDPLAVALAVFLLVVALATLYGDAPWPARWSALSGWRKALLLFFAAAVFDDDDSRRDLMRVYLAVCLLAVIASFIGYFGEIQVHKFNGYGVLIHNYATQSFAFSIAAGISGLAFLAPGRFVSDPLLGRRWLVGAALVLFVADIAFVLPGRSGYIVVLVMATVLAFALAGRTLAVRLVVAIAVIGALATLIAASDVARHRIALAVSEMTSAEHAPDLTSAGVRVVMWKNAGAIIAEHPIAGVGTGGFRTAYERQVAGESGWRATPAGDPHNQFLKIWAEQGLVGLVAFLAFVAAGTASRAAPPARDLGLAILLAGCASSLFNSHFSTFTEGRMVFLWVGALLARDLTSTER